MVDHRRTPGQRAYRLPGWFFLGTGVLSALGLAFAGWVLLANPFGGPAPQASPEASPTAASRTSSAPTATRSPSVAPTRSTPKPKATSVRDGIKVVILNATHKQGLAAKVADTAEKAGWTVADVGNWPYPAAQNAVYYPDGHQAEGQLLGEDLSIASVRPVRPGMSIDQLTVIVLTAP